MDASFWEEVERSRRMTLQQRFLGTLEMIDMTRRLNVDGIRHQFPDADETRIREILLQRYRIARELDAIP